MRADSFGGGIMREFEFHSALGTHMADLIRRKRALGYRYDEGVRILKRFDGFCLERFPGETTVTKEMLDVWAVKRPCESPGTFRIRVTVVSHLALHMAALGLEARAYPTNELPKEPGYIPYIFSEDELRRVFRQIDCCHYSPEVPNRHLIMPVLFRILYCCGLRPGEALRLKTEDVDLEKGVLLIRDSKNGNSRYVPMSLDLTELCRKYASEVHETHPEYRYFFPSPSNGMISSMNLYSNFRRFLRKAGVSYGGKGKGPRPYDFRHTFAVHTLKRMVLSGENPETYHQALKTYMGHSFFKYTAYYLRLTKDMFPDIRQKIESRFRSLYERGERRD